MRSKWSSSTGLTPGSSLSLFSLRAIRSLKASRSLENTSDGRQLLLRVQGKLQHQHQQQNWSNCGTLHKVTAYSVKIKGQRTYKFSFRSGFSLEPWDTGVSLNTHAVREWEASELEGKTAAAARSAASFCRWNKNHPVMTYRCSFGPERSSSSLRPRRSTRSRETRSTSNTRSTLWREFNHPSQ